MSARRSLKAFWVDQSGATAVELGIMVAIICVMVISALGLMGRNLNGVFTKLSGSFTA